MKSRFFKGRTLPTIVIGLLVLLLVVTAAGCGGSTTATPVPAPTQEPTATNAAAATGAPTAMAPATVDATPPVATSAPPATEVPTTAASPTAAAASVSAVPACPPSGAATELQGAGGTFPAPLYTRWFADYEKLCHVKVNYQAIGSGGGIKQITAKTVDFGASDGILTADQHAAAPGVIMVPMTSGAEAIVANLEGLQNGQLKLTPDTLAGIFLGTITKWNDPKLAADNAGLKLPATDITVVHRADGSGTTNIFTSYLSQVSPEWKSKVGSGNSVKWPVGVGGEGNAGVAGQVKQLPGAVGYVELAYAIQNKMPWAALKNQAGQFLEPSLDGTTVAMQGVQIPDNTEVMIVNSSDPKGYPIAGMTWILLYKDQPDMAKAQTLLHLLWWGLHDGQKEAPDLGYAPLSSAVVTKAEAELRSVTAKGQPVLQ